MGDRRTVDITTERPPSNLTTLSVTFVEKLVASGLFKWYKDEHQWASLHNIRSI